MNSKLLFIALFVFCVGCEIPDKIPCPHVTVVPTVPVPPEVPVPDPIPTEVPNPPNPPVPEPTAPPSPEPVFYLGDAEFQPYVNKFIADGLIQGVPLSTKSPDLHINFGDLSQYGAGVVGLCDMSSGRSITISTKFWNNVSDVQKELLLHHELGHCVLYRPHREDKFADGREKSIMYPIILKESVYTPNYDYYQKELYTFSGLSLSPNTYICGE